MSAPTLGATVRFALYDGRGVRMVSGQVMKLKSHRRTGEVVSVCVDLTAQGYGTVVVPTDRLEVLR